MKESENLWLKKKRNNENNPSLQKPELHKTQINNNKKISEIKPKEKRLYNLQRWKKLSKLFLQKNPLCVSCNSMGNITASQCVDHIHRHNNNLDLFWDESNWQALCNSCHSTKTIAETIGVSYIHNDLKVNTNVMVVCGPVGSGRQEYINKHVQDNNITNYIIISKNIIANHLFNNNYYNLEDINKNITIATYNALINSIDDNNYSVAYIINDEPNYYKRREFVKHFNKYELVIILKSVNDIVSEHGQHTERTAKQWWNRYTSGIDERKVGYG